MSLALSSLSYDPPAPPSVERRPASPDVAASNTQNAQISVDAEAGPDPYAQIDSLLASLRDLTLGGASLKSASTTAQANSAYAAIARD